MFESKRRSPLNPGGQFVEVPDANTASGKCPLGDKAHVRDVIIEAGFHGTSLSIEHQDTALIGGIVKNRCERAS